MTRPYYHYMLTTLVRIGYHLRWCSVVIMQTVTITVELLTKTKSHSFAIKLSFEYLHIYSSKVAIFVEKNSRIASLMSCQRSALRKTLKILVSTAKTTKLASVIVLN